MAGSPNDRAGAARTVPHVTRRTLEVWTAAAVAAVGGAVVAESLTHDIGWNETGPGSGYFPFRVGVLLIGVSMLAAWQGLRGPGSASNSENAASGPGNLFVTREELRRSLSVFWPTAALVIAMFPLGCYVPSAAYLAWMMRRHGGHGWLLSVVYGLVVTIVFFLIFDVWFRVPLAKGPLEGALGL